MTPATEREWWEATRNSNRTSDSCCPARREGIFVGAIIAGFVAVITWTRSIAFLPNPAPVPPVHLRELGVVVVTDGAVTMVLA